jgi:hypothetical protein
MDEIVWEDPPPAPMTGRRSEWRLRPLRAVLRRGRVVSRVGTLVISVSHLDGMRKFAADHDEPVLAECIAHLLDCGITVNLPARQLAAIAETLRPIVEEVESLRETVEILSDDDAMAAIAEAEAEGPGFTPSGVNG